MPTFPALVPRALGALLVGALQLTPMTGSTQPPAPPPAQPPARGAVPAGDAERPCTGMARVIALVVRRADGTPVTDAEVTARDGERVLARLTQASLADGNYLVFTEERAPELRGGRGTVRLTVRWRGAVRHVRWTLGPDAAGCHTVLLRGPQAVRFP
jgi:hypothetical protein